MKKEEKVSKKSWFKLAGLIYLFIFSIELLKRTSLALAPSIKDFLSGNLNPLNAICAGWFTTSVAQSSGAVGSITVAFTGNNLIPLQTAIFVLLGAFFGTTITALIISFITEARKRRDFRHGFEIGLCYSIYSAILVIIVFLLEYFFRLFSRTSMLIAPHIHDKISLLKVPDLIGIITSPIINFLSRGNHRLLLLLLAFLILIFALKSMGKVVMEVFGGRDKAKNFVNRHFNSKYKSYFLGVILTAIVFSSSITIRLLVPLAVVRLINLKKAIPFIIGANLGTFTDIFLAAVFVGQTNALAAAIAYLMFSLTGSIIFLPNTQFLFNTTKYFSKRFIHISRKKALYFLIVFILIPLLIILIF